MPQYQVTQPDQENLDDFLAVLRGEYAPLKARIHNVEHSETCECSGVTIRVHYPALRDGIPTVEWLIEVISFYLTGFCLPRSQISKLDNLYKQISAPEFRLKSAQLEQEAINLFKKAQKATNRNGEAGELLLYLLTEWILEAPQILAKMGLKTNKQMPVYGADGVHIKFRSDDNKLVMYWGESKLYSDVDQAISKAVLSITEALQHEKIAHELSLVGRYIDLSGLDEPAKSAILKYLDPFEPASNDRVDTTMCLIGFDSKAFSSLDKIEKSKVDEVFKSGILSELKSISPKVSKALKNAGIEQHIIELFLFPVPSVKQLRDLFQARIGWNN